MNLYDIEQRYRAALDQLSEADAPPELIRDTLEAIQGEAEARLIALAGVLLERRAEAAMIREAATRLSQRLQRAEARAVALERALLASLAALHLPGLECPAYAVQVRPSPPTVVIGDEAQLPEAFVEVQTVRRPLRAAIRKALEAGQAVETCELQRGQHLVFA